MICRLTRESARAARACYDDARLAELIPPEGLSPYQVAALPIAARDRLWALNRACGAPPRHMWQIACWIARALLEAERAAGRETDPRSWAAVETAERYLRGEATDQEMRAAVDAADSAYSYAYSYAAYAAYAYAYAAYAYAYSAAACSYAAAYAYSYADSSTEILERIAEKFAEILESANAQEVES